MSLFASIVVEIKANLLVIILLQSSNNLDKATLWLNHFFLYSDAACVCVWHPSLFYLLTFQRLYLSLTVLDTNENVLIRSISKPWLKTSGLFYDASRLVGVGSFRRCVRVHRYFRELLLTCTRSSWWVWHSCSHTTNFLFAWHCQVRWFCCLMLTTKKIDVRVRIPLCSAYLTHHKVPE